MRRKYLKIAYISFLFVLFVIQPSGCSDKDNSLKKYWIVIPSASYSSEDVDFMYPECPTIEQPNICPQKQGCCPEGYPYGCASQNKCYATPPVNECADFVECLPPEVIIKSVLPSKITAKVDESEQVIISYKKYGTEKLMQLIIKITGVQGHFTYNLSESESSSGEVPLEIFYKDKKPEDKDCKSCNNSECKPCYKDVTLTGSRFDFGLKDEKGNLWGNMLNYLIFGITEDNSQNAICNDGSDCCKIKEGEINAQIVSITTPESCDCPPNTTYSMTDKYGYKICDCNDCKE